MTDEAPGYPSTGHPGTSQAAPGHEAPEDVKVALTPLRIALGVIAIIVGIGAGLLMSTATLFK